jgi:preprotein translocase subunit YajC
MEQEVIKMAASQGLWALLFVVLLFWVLRENAKREEKYQNILQDLTNRLLVLEDIQHKVCKISDRIFGGD